MTRIGSGRTVALVPVSVLSYDWVTPPNIASLRAAAKRTGIALLEVQPDRLALRVSASGAQVTLDGQPWAPETVLHRTVWQLIGITQPALELLAGSGTAVVNPIGAAVASRDKLRTAMLLVEAGIPTVPTGAIASGSAAALPESPGGQPWLVSKPALGLRGNDVYLHPTPDALSAHVSSMPADGSVQVLQPCWGQPGTDFRAFVVDGECRALMRRQASAGVFTANLAQGGQGEPLDPESHPAARVAVDAVTALQLDYAGVDLVGDPDETPHGLAVLEVDAWAGWVGIEAVTGARVADAILELAAKRARQ